MAVNKNFVVKNGLEVNTDLIFADASTEKVGIGSTIPSRELDVIGGIGATNLNLTGVGTIPTIKGTTGIVSTIVAHNVQAGNLDVTGISSIGSLGTLSELYISGVATVSTLDVIGTANIPVGIITNVQGSNGNFSGILTAASLGSGFGIGIGSTGSDGLGASGLVGYGFTQLNFIGLGVSDVLFNTSVGIATIWIAGGGGGSGNVSIGSEAPGSPSSGDLWYSTEYGRTFIWFDEETLGIGNTAVWVDSAPFNQGGLFLSKYGDNAYGAIGYTGGTTSQASVYFTGDPNTGLIQPAADHVNIVAGGTKSLEVNPSGISVVGVITGDGSGLTGVASTDNIITSTEAKLLGGVVTAGIVTVGTALSLADSVKAKFGDSGDLQLYHDGTNSYITNATADLRIRSGYVKLQGINEENMLIGNQNTSVELYYDNTKRIETASDDKGGGVIVTGKIVGTAATIGTGVTINNTGIDACVSLGIVTAKHFNGLGANFSGGTVYNYKIVGTAATIGTGVTINNTGIDMGIAAGICTAKEFYGDGSNLTGIAAGGSGQFNTSISGATQYDVTASMATAYTASASATIRTVVHSIHICNVSGSEVTISGEIQSSFSFAHTIPVPAGSAVELLKQPKVLGPSETIELQASSGSALEATIIVEEKEDTALWDAQLDLTSATTMTDLYTSSTYPSVVQSILLANDDGSNDVKARVAWTDGGDSIQSYLVYDMVIPADSTVEICEKPKYLAAGYKLRAYANQADRLEITASGSQIVS